MIYRAAPSVQIDAWVSIGSDTEICYEVSPADGDVEFTIGDPDGLKLSMRETTLRRCVAAFIAALDALTTGHPAPPDVTPFDAAAPASAG